MPAPFGEDAQRGEVPGPAAAHSLALVIPAWNEEAAIGQAIQQAEAALASLTTNYEIIVVDDGSSDRTAEVVRAEVASNPHIRLVQHAQNLGYGAALRSGFRAATRELVAFTDADCQFDLHELEYMLPLARHYDITCGYRIDRQDSTRRRFFSWGYNTLVSLLLGSPVRDLDCALKIFRRAPLQDILPECDDFFVNAEMLTRARLRGLSVVEVGVHHRPRVAGHSTVSLAAIPRTLATLLPFWWSRILFPAQENGAARFGSGSWAGLLLIALVAGPLLFLNLSYPLIKPDEGRYVEIGREMLTTGDWVVPTLHHAPYFDKPPLYYWLTAGSFACFGTNERAARLVPACAALLTILATMVFGTRILGARAGFLAALVLSLTAGFIQCGRFIVVDSVFTLFVTLALFSAYEAVRGERLRWSAWLVAAVCCALGVLTKGPAALVLFVPPVVAHAWLTGSTGRPRRVHWLAYAGLVLGLVAPWYVAVSFRDPQFVRHFFIDQHLLRFFGGKYHNYPVWYYVPVLLIGGLPWSLLAYPFARFLFGRARPLAELRVRALGFFVLWAGWCVLFFSLSRGKLPPYILPALPALALLLGSYLDRVAVRASLGAVFDEARSRLPLQTVTVIAWAWLLLGSYGWWKQLVDTAEYLIESGVCVACILGVTWAKRRLQPKAAWALCGLAMMAMIYESAHELVPAWSCQRSPLMGSDEFAALLNDKDTAVAAYQHDSCSIAADKEDVPCFTYRPQEDLRKYFTAHPRNLLVTKSTQDRDSLAWAVPGGMEISQVLDNGETRVFVIQATGLLEQR